MVDKLTIYTDGACSGNPGSGGWGFVAIHPTTDGSEHLVLLSGGDKQTTNNRMELQAAIEALKYTMANRTDRTVAIYTDSKYVQQGITEWLPGWKAKNWVGSNKKPVKNQDLWRDLDSLNSIMQVEWCRVKGHSGDRFNDMADELAVKESQAFKNL